MTNYSIWADAAADMDREYIPDGTVGVLPMEYTLGEHRRTSAGKDTEEELHAFYDLQREGSVTHTSQITPALYREYFGPDLDRGGVMYLALSGGLTRTVESALMAREKLMRDHQGDLEVVDTLSASCGIGLMAEKAVENREKGMSLADNAAAMRCLSARVCHIFMVEDLMFLKRGGRIGAAAAVMGTMMGVKPLLIIGNDGCLTTLERTRGHKAAQREMLRLYQAAACTGERRVFITHGDAPDLARELKEQLLSLDASLRVSVHPLSPVIGAHTGPGMVSLVFFGDRNKLSSLN